MKRFADVQSKVPIVKLSSIITARKGAKTSLQEMNSMAKSGKVSAMENTGGV